MHGSDLIKFWGLAAALAWATGYSFWYCWRAWRRNRMIEDTPTSRVRSAAQGYVEFAGRGLALPDTENRAPLSGIPCLWWYYKIEERKSAARSRSWATLRTDTSDTPFLLDDGTGQCLVDPRGAEVFACATHVWYGRNAWPRAGMSGLGSGWLAGLFTQDDYRYTERRLEPRQRIYAIGAYRSLGGVDSQSPERAVAELLREWKQDQRSLVARFDADHDGKLSAQEWESARAAARAQIEALPAQPQSPGFSVLSEPQDGRAFLLAASSEESLARQFRWRAAAAGAVFLASSTALTWLLRGV